MVGIPHTHLKISLGIFVLMQSDLPLINVYSDTSLRPI